MKYHADPHLPRLVGTTTTEEKAVDDPTLHVHMIANAAAPIPTRALINPNANGRTVQQ